MPQINQKVLTRQLQIAGFQTAVAYHGLECLKLLERTAKGERHRFDLILLDYIMPLLNGIETAMEIRRREKSGEFSGHTPIIMVSGNARREYVEEGQSIYTRLLT